jgi:RimJ/RimL family protein N-acetyltransferase
MTGCHDPDVILATDRLLLKRWEAEDLNQLIELHRSSAVNRYLSSNGRPWTPQDAQRALAKWSDEHVRMGLGKMKLVERETGRFVGRAGFSPYGHNDHELGFTIAPDYRGRGYATEIARALARRFFEDGRAARFIAFAHPDNAASLAVIRKLGMRACGTVRVGAVEFLNFERRIDD